MRSELHTEGGGSTVRCHGGDAAASLVEARFAERRERRKREIDRLVDAAKRSGDVVDRLYWTMVYDFEMAPMTTNLAQLAEIGVEVPLPEELDDAAIAAKLQEVVQGLARLQVYLLHTDHLDDRSLYSRLRQRVLLEEVREVPADPGVREFIDLLAPGDGEDYELLFDAYACRPDEEPQGERSSLFVADRDRHLPSPPEHR